MKSNELSSMLLPESYPHSCGAISVIETHISWIFLTGDYAYKIKKPVDFGFLNFTTLELRKQYCDEELRLNRRAAPDLYLGVESLYQNKHGVNFFGQGTLTDYAVKMKQFNPKALLGHVMVSDPLPHSFFDELAVALAEFHNAIDVSCADDAFGSLQSIERPVEENFRQLKPFLINADDRLAFDAIKKWSLQKINTNSSVFSDRKKFSHVRECHGDLHMGNIAVMNDKAVLFDAIEFNESFRWIDTASDIAFLLMDLEFNGFYEQANILLNRYLDYSFDYDLLPVLSFYKVYRAMVRAKVAALRSGQITDSQLQHKTMNSVHSYLQFAFVSTKPRNSYLLMTCGVSGSGKSTFAQQYCAKTGSIHLKSDVVRKHLAGLKPLESSASVLGETVSIYTPEFNQKTFSYLLMLAEKCIASGFSVVLDATFLTQRSRAPFIELAEKLNVPAWICHLEVGQSDVVSRLKLRSEKGNDPSEAGVEVMQSQLKMIDKFTVKEQKKRISVKQSDGSYDIDYILNRIGERPLSDAFKT